MNYRYRLCYTFVRRGGILDGLVIEASFPVCSYSDALEYENNLYRTLDVISTRIEEIV